jgi:hypothetical protein
MEIADIRKRVHATIARARQHAAERRARADQASRDYGTFLDTIAVPLFRQTANVLRAEGYLFSVFTPSGSVKMVSDRSGEDFVELLLDTSDAEPRVVAHSSRSRGRRVIEAERSVGDPASIDEQTLLELLMRELEPFVER